MSTSTRHRSKNYIASTGQEATAKPKASTITAAFLAATGVLHFAKPENYDAIVPRILPGSPRLYTYASGVAELGIAGMLALPKTRRAGGLAAVALYTAVFPANVQMAWDWRCESLTKRVIAYGRLPLQLPLICHAWKIFNSK